jgi:hypothetical protein
MDAKLIRPSAKGSVALILPNLNVDLRPLPDSVPADLADPAKAVVPDKDKPVRRLTDPQLYELRIEVTPAEQALHPGLVAIIDGVAPPFVLFDASGRTLTNATLDIAAEFARSTKIAAGALTYFIEAQTFLVSPGIPRPAPSLKVTFSDGNQTLKNVALPLFVSDLILVGDNEPPLRLYIAEINENQPSLFEVREAAAVVHVPVVTVPEVVCNGDTWLQDQFQFGLAMDDANRLQTVVLHLPRMRSNGQVVAASDNLAAFVDNHFPSRDISIFKDFWDTAISVPVVGPNAASTLQLSVRDSNGVLNALMPVTRLWARITLAISQLGGSTPGTGLQSFYEKRAQLQARLAVLQAIPAGNSDQKREKDALTAALAEKLADLDKSLPLVAGGVQLTINQKRVEVAAAALDDLYDQLTALHSSGNYGGNIEVSPPTADAPLGKVVTGDVASRDVQACLNGIATQTASQPWVQVSTGWLSVGHIDEIASFVVPRSSGAGSLAVLRASPRVALTILDAAKKAKGQGKLVTRLFRGKRWRHEEARSTTDPLYPPQAYNFLVTSYGKYDLSDFRNPPGHIPVGPSAFYDDRKYLFYLSGSAPPRDYAAHMSVEEVLDICRDTNQTIDDVLLGGKAKAGIKSADYTLLKDIPPAYVVDLVKQSLDSVISAKFPAATSIPLPVLFDRVESFATQFTEAFTPGLVNLQQLGDTLLVPRPLGPRMRPVDAIAVLGSLLGDDSAIGLPTTVRKNVLKLLTPANLHSRGLDVTRHWTSSSQSCLRWEPASLNGKGYRDAVDTLDMLAEIFRDGFDEFVNPARDYTKGDHPLSQPARKDFDQHILLVRKRIAQANPGAFDALGYVNASRWIRIMIPENTVDLFEVYAQLVLEALGLSVQWLDSWFYHVHAGGIHCGTNVLRRVNAADWAARIAKAARQ